MVTELQNALACAGRVFDLIEEKAEIPDNADAAVLEHIDGTVDLEHVYFSYVPDKKLIEDFNLHVEQGQRVAIVGPTGCGKTTMINLLMRFYDADSGVISVSGHPIKEVTRKSLRENYGMVLQETWLGCLSVCRNDPGKYPLRKTGCDRRGSHSCSKSGTCTRIYPASAKRIRYGDQ